MTDKREVTLPVHPDYSLFLEDWQLMRDSQEGERKIKDEGETYLPMPSGTKVIQDKDVRVAAYNAYKHRAHFPELVSQTVRGLTGVIHRRETTIELPELLEPIREQATREGLTLNSLHRRITRELFITGRVGLLADIGSNGRPYIATYIAEHIINWDTDEDENLILVVLDESRWERRGLDWVWENRFRKLELIDGVYRIFLLDESGKEIEEIQPERISGSLDFIPFTFIDTNDLTPEPDEVPLIGIARLALRLYELDADYRQTLHLTSGPTYFFAGFVREELPSVIGSGALIASENEQARAELLEYEGSGASSQRQAIIDAFEQAVQMGARMMQQENRTAESGDALRLRFGNQFTTIDSISKTSTSGLENALRHLARWINLDPELINAEAPSDFIEQKLSSQEMDSFMRSMLGGTISWSTYFWNMQQGGRIPPDRTAEEELAEIQTQAVEPQPTSNPFE